MKKLSVILAAVMALGLAVSACGGGDDDNDCIKAGKVILSGMDEGCSGKDDCAFCKCWNDGHKTVGADGETCEAPQDEGCKDDPKTEEDECACEGEALTQAQECLADEAACKQAGKAIVDMACPSDQ